MKNRIILFLYGCGGFSIGLLFIGLLWACTETPANQERLQTEVVMPFGYSHIVATEVTTLDGRIVTCVENSHGSIACDFDHTRQPKAEK